MPKFYCEHCGKRVRSDAKICNHCGRFFSKVKCPKCNFRGVAKQFATGCPDCGYLAEKEELIVITRNEHKIRMLQGKNVWLKQDGSKLIMPAVSIAIGFMFILAAVLYFVLVR